jgi:hypothetical protein
MTRRMFLRDILKPPYSNSREMTAANGNNGRNGRRTRGESKAFRAVPLFPFAAVISLFLLSIHAFND